MVKVGFTIVVLLKAAVLPAGRVVRLHLKVRGSPSTSVEFAPLSCTTAPTFTGPLGPVMTATGLVFEVEMVTMAVLVLLALPSFTTNCTLYVPNLSTTKVGETVLAPVRVAVLPAGRWMKVQEKVRGSPSTSEEPAPVRCTVVPTGTV